MPTQVTYWAPGHQEATGPVPGSSAWIVHSQVTFSAPWPRNSVTMCRHAATKVPGGVCPYPHEYQGAFISCPNPITTACPKSRTRSA